MVAHDIHSKPLGDAVTASHCACFNLRKAARAVTQAYDAALAPAGLKATQFTLLQAIELTEGMTLGRIAENLGMDRTTLTRNLAQLEKRGWITLRAGEDRRERTAALTKIGRETVEIGTPLWRAAQQRFTDRLGATRWNEIRSELDAVVDAVP